MYAPMLQSNTSDASGIQCIVFLVILFVVAVVLGYLASKTKSAPLYSEKITTSLSREEAKKIIKSHFPKNIVSSAFNWKSSWSTDEKLVLSGYYLTSGQGCATMLLTGIIPGYFLIKSIMGRSEEVVVDFSKHSTSGELTLEAKGLRAQQEVDKLIYKLLNEAEQHYEQASAYEEQNEFDEALKECDAAIQITPNYADAHNLRGIVLEGLGRKEEAVLAYREAIRSDPTYSEAAENLKNLEDELKSASIG